MNPLCFYICFPCYNYTNCHNFLCKKRILFSREVYVTIEDKVGNYSPIRNIITEKGRYL